METPATALKSIPVAEIYRWVDATKTESSARNYRAMLGRMEEYLLRLHDEEEQPVITLEEITPEFVAGFGEHLLAAGVAPSTIRLYKKFLRASLKEFYGPELRDQFKTAFRDVESSNETRTNTISRSDVEKIASAPLLSLSLPLKVRDLWLFSLYGGGQTFPDIDFSPVVPQQSILANRFLLDHKISLHDFAAGISVQEYERVLDTIAYLLQLGKPLKASSSADGWIDVARSLSLPVSLIDAAVKTDTAFSKNVAVKVTYSPEEIKGALKSVADAVSDVCPRWYVMRCFEQTAEDTAETIRRLTHNLHGETFETFSITPPILKMLIDSSL